MPQAETSDEQILRLISRPQTLEQGFRLLVGMYQERLYWQVRRMLLDHEDANDVLQNCLVKVYRNIDKFEGKSGLYTWLYRIACNEALSFLEKKKRQSSASLDDEVSAIGKQLKADEFFDGDAAQIRLQQALVTLPEKQRQVFNLRYFEEMGYQEMSTLLDTSVGALKASFHHAVKKIESFLEEK